MDISELVQCEGQLASMSAVKLVVGLGGGGGGVASLQWPLAIQNFIMALIIPALIQSFFTVIQGVE